jgi:hypothetical protein
MMLTLNQALWIILTVAAVVVMAFLAMFLNQARKAAREAEATLVKARGAIDELQVIEAKINANLDNVGQVLAVSKKAVTGLTEATSFLSSRVIKPSMKFWPLLALPLLRVGLTMMKRRKEKKDG